MKFLIAVALLVVGLSPGPGSGQTSEAPTDGKSTREGKFVMSRAPAPLLYYYRPIVLPIVNL